MKLTIWCNASLPEAARRELELGLSRHRLLWAKSETNNLSSGGASLELREADAAFGQPDPEQAIALATLKWVHLTSAGYTHYDRQDLRDSFAARGAILTNSSSVFDEPCAQHLLAFMLGMARQLPQAASAQARGSGWEYDHLREAVRILDKQSVLILGYGAIARRLIELLAPFNLEVVAVRRTVCGDEAGQVWPVGELDRLLPKADHVVSTLPANPSTDRCMDGVRFGMMKPGALFYNVGRGTTVDQDALLEALRSGRLGGAYLDVTEPEPLQSDHPLWTAPNCFITPHIAGGMGDEPQKLVRHFLANLGRFEAGEALLDRVI